MRLKKIVLQNFRNYKRIDFYPGEGINVLLGKNAQGKTNLLESIYYLSFFTSHRTGNDSTLINLNSTFFKLLGEVVIDNYPLNLEVLYTKDKKNIIINGEKLEITQRGIGKVNTVLFTPEDLYLVKGPPSTRREFLDREIIQINPLYAKHLSRYNRILKHRNNILKDKIKGHILREDISPWDQQLCDYGSYIIIKRKETLKKLNLLARLQHRKITGNEEDIRLRYISSLCIENDINREEVKSVFMESLIKNFKEDERRGFTSLGPHRDDFEICIDNQNARTFASQGQQRTAVLSLKLSQIELVKGEKGVYPILLLDDVFSELDEKRRKLLLSIIKGKIQTIITATDIKYLGEIVFDNCLFFKVEGGSVVPWKK